MNELVVNDLEEDVIARLEARAKEHGHSGQRGPVLPPGDPGHPPPRHRLQAGVLFRAGGHGRRGHFVTSVGSVLLPQPGPGSAAAPGSRR